MVHFNHIKEKVLYDYRHHDICSANFITMLTCCSFMCFGAAVLNLQFPYDRQQLNVQINNPEIGIT
jgi:hypothetical protein